jgi:D-alanyl-D-alanine carboxypeptidase (penicillin-binding protein 5/6)
MNFKKILSIITIFTVIVVPIFSFADDYIENDISLIDSEINTSSDLSETPNINARHAVIFDRTSKTVLFGKKENEICKMASTTKIMTAIVVIENCNNLNDTVTVSKKAARYRWF